ncbi:UDP-N-acetylglucosamine 2-epimerase [Haloferax mucosum ATCC BAA-1512]|uniref:UDP-N-acetylglucosamine 2-epimerase n=1 Tax=Haloferax mucosum ATCC BAA-1512 TaxID=662479 RepID=M0IJX1_9EURY|nr:UDP-N-acetylglucosamine 2-epimerase (non-hydrolyzing) [Haloferax mucosum]ELZ97025.1 UDP-N-acetylglucosamine 2-epimerase [Haloferax mucosum ATCC BAA-1512]
MKVLSVIGARPQFVKASVVSRELRKHHEEILVHTGQHYDEELSDVFFEELGIPKPDHNLGVGSASHAKQTGEMMIQLEELVTEYDPDVVLSYGDTNSTLAASIVASKMDAEMAHVEAGLRSFNRDMPEEVNRILTDHVSDYLFVPSQQAIEHLEAEGITESVYNVGDVMYDALLWVQESSADEPAVLKRLGLDPNNYILATVHRPRNTDDAERLAAIIDCLCDDPREVVFPAHPRTVSCLADHGLLERADEELTLIDPVGYGDFIGLQANSELIVTDSGGIQKEAFFLNIPCVTLREETEWPETVEEGGNVLVGADPEKIRDALASPPISTSDATPYGDGTAGEKIVEVLSS